MTITEREMTRRRLVALAGKHLLDAMSAFTEEYIEMSAGEWLKAINDSLVQRLIAEQVKGEWEEGS